jgi:hypothetical protein
VGVLVAETDYAEGSDFVAETGEMVAYAEVFVWAVEGLFFWDGWRGGEQTGVCV